MKDWRNLIADEDHWMSKHYSLGRGGKPIRMIALHHNAGNLSLTGIWQTWQTRQASAHYQVDINGRIGQYVRDRDTAWAVGGGHNQDTISIEHANNRLAPDWTISEATLDNGAHLVAALCHYYGLGRPKWMKNVFPHQYFMPTGCPGAIAGKQNKEYMARAQAWYDAMSKGQESLGETVSPGKVKGDNMLLREPDGAIYEVSGGVATRIGDPNLVQALVNAGVPLIQIGAGQIGWWHKRTADDNSMGNRVREMKDLLTDYPGMSDTLKRTSLLREVAGKLGITSRTK